MVDHLGLKVMLHSDIAVINLFNIRQLPVEILHPRLALALDEVQLVLQIAHHQPYDEQLRHPHIGIVIHQHFKP